MTSSGLPGTSRAMQFPGYLAPCGSHEMNGAILAFLRRQPIFIRAPLLLCLGSPTQAKRKDVVIMHNSDHFTGQIKRPEDGLLYVETDHVSGNIGLDWNQVQSLESTATALRRKPKAWVYFMMRFELGLEEPDPGRSAERHDNRTCLSRRRPSSTFALHAYLGSSFRIPPLRCSHPSCALVTEVPGTRQYSLPHTYTENLHARVLTDFRDSSNRHLRRRSFAEIRPDHRSRAERVGGWNPGLKKRRIPYTMPAVWRKNTPADSVLLLCLTNHK